ncbi:alpha/beta hydrolase [bacterium]|nr:alpha/beta hydrolase [bacterium]
MKKTAAALLIIALAFSLFGCGFISSVLEKKEQSETDNTTIPPKDNFDVTKSIYADVAYGESEKQKLDILLPSVLGDLTDPVPFFLLIHGGSWTGGDKSDYYFLKELLNNYGYAAVTVNYRLIGDGVTYKDMLNDIESALSYLKDNASVYKLKTDAVALWGGSAGGHLALLYGYKNRSLSPIPIAMIVSQVGPTDFTDENYYSASDDKELKYRLNLISALTGVTMTENDIGNEYPEEIYDASPITHADINYPPTLMAYGEKDALVPFSNAQRLYDRLNGLNENKVKLVSFPNSGHDLSDDPDKTAEAQSVLAQAALRYFPSDGILNYAN